MAQLWEVIGGADKGGILVRQGLDLGSEKFIERLSTGALLQELDCKGDRLHYRLLTGVGPPIGWVTVRLTEKELVVKAPLQKRDLLLTLGPEVTNVRVWALSDIHVENPQNMSWIKGLSVIEYYNDILLLAGDVANSIDKIEEALQLLTQIFGRVFFVPGNHDLWTEIASAKQDLSDSLRKLQSVRALCDRMGVETRPAAVPVGSDSIVLVVPMYSWYHASFDTEPNLTGWEGAEPANKMAADFRMTKWPDSVSMQDESVAELLDRVNDSLFPCDLGAGEGQVTCFEELCEWSRMGRFKGVVSFSHFLPRIELLPERCYMAYPNLMKIVGSNFLADRVRGLRPTCHVFGHTHYGWDADIDGVRYLQGALGTVSERSLDAVRLSVDGFLDGSCIGSAPLLVFDNGSVPPLRRSPFATFYTFYKRDARNTSIIAPWVAKGLKKIKGGGGLVSLRGRAPPWLMAPERMVVKWARRLVEESREESTEFRQLPPRDLLRLLNGVGRPPVILDARTGPSFSLGHIPNAISASNPETLALDGGLDAVVARFSQLTDHTRLKVVYGSVAMPGRDVDMAKAVISLAQIVLPDSDVRLLRGGFEAWVAVGGCRSGHACGRRRAGCHAT